LVKERERNERLSAEVDRLQLAARTVPSDAENDKPMSSWLAFLLSFGIVAAGFMFDRWVKG
jgi:hypothetical protein